MWNGGGSRGLETYWERLLQLPPKRFTPAEPGNLFRGADESAPPWRWASSGASRVAHGRASEGVRRGLEAHWERLLQLPPKRFTPAEPGNLFRGADESAPPWRWASSGASRVAHGRASEGVRRGLEAHWERLLQLPPKKVNPGGAVRLHSTFSSSTISHGASAGSSRTV